MGFWVLVWIALSEDTHARTNPVLSSSPLLCEAAPLFRSRVRARARAHTHNTHTQTHTHTHTHQHQTEASSIKVKRQLFPVGHVPVDDCLARYVTPVSIRPLDKAGGRHRFWRADRVREGESAPAHEQGREREPGTLAMAELKTSSNRLPAPISCAVTSAHGLRSSCAGAGVWK